MKKAGIYRRVSTDEQIDGTSLGSQEVDGRRTAQAAAYEVAEVYSDEGVSGTVYDRPELQRALADLEAGKIDALICWDVSRLSRNVEHQQRILRRIRSAGGRLLLCRGGFEDTDEGDLMFGISGSFAQYERRVFRSRAMRGRKALAEAGVQPSRTFSPYGFHIVTKQDKIDGLYLEARPGDYVQVEEEIRWVKEIFRLYAAGWSLGAIARYLNDHGVKTSKGGAKWRASAFCWILANPIYIGQIYFGRSETVGEEGLPFKKDPQRIVKNGKRNLNRPEEEWVSVGTIPPVIDRETWETCQRLAAWAIEEKQRMLGGNPDRRFMLGGLLFCPVCGMRYIGNTGGAKFPQNRSYHCRPKEEACRRPRPRINAALAEKFVMKHLLFLHDSPQSIREAISAYDAHQKAQQCGGEQERERARLNDSLRQVQSDLDHMKSAMLEGMRNGLSAADFASDMKALSDRRKGIEEKIQALAPVELKANGGDILTAAGKLAAIASAIVKVFEASDDDLSEGEKRTLLLPIIERIVPDYGGQGLRIFWKTDTVQYV